MSYNLPIDKGRYDYRNNELFYNSLMQHCEDSVFFDYNRIFDQKGLSPELTALCRKQFETFTRERIPILMTMPLPDYHAIYTAKNIALHQTSYHLKRKKDSDFLKEIADENIQNFSERVLEDVLFGQSLTQSQRNAILKRISPRDCYFYYLRYLKCLEPEQMAQITVWKASAIPSYAEHVNKRIAKAILPEFAVDMRYKDNRIDAELKKAKGFIE